MAIAIPVFNNQLISSKEAADMANLRAAYGEAVADHLALEEDYPTSYNADKFGTLNYSGKATWDASDGLTVTYVPEKANGGETWSVSSVTQDNG